MNRRDGQFATIFNTTANAPMYQHHPHQHQQQQQQDDSPARRIYDQRSARSFTRMMRGDGPDYLQEHRGNPYQQPQPTPPSPPATGALMYDASSSSTDWMSRQERLLHDIERRLDRLEEQQFRRSISAPIGGNSGNNGNNETILRLLDQMQTQQQQMQRMQQQMDELRHTMELAMQRERFAALNKQHQESGGSSINTTLAPPAPTPAPITPAESVALLSASPQSAPQQMPQWLGAAMVITFVFALVSILIAIIAVSRTKTNAAPPNTAFIPLDLSQSLPALVASSPAWNSMSGSAADSRPPASSNRRRQVYFSP